MFVYIETGTKVNAYHIDGSKWR